MEILQTLLENEILNEETKKELEEAISKQISEAVEAAVEKSKEETEVTVRAELAEQFVQDKEALVEALDTKVQQFLESEMVELKDDVENFRDLEKEYAEKVVELKKNLAETAKKDFTQLVDILNEFLEDRINAEFEELKEDIEEVKKIKFGQKVYESIKDTFESEYFDKDEIDRKAQETKTKLERTQNELNEAKKELNATKREAVLNETLSTLDGRPREVMAAILQNTPTDRIPKVYDQFISRVLNESVVDGEEKEDKVLADKSDDTQLNEGKENKKDKKTLTETVELTGDDKKTEVVSGDDDDDHRLDETTTNRLRDLMGLMD